MELAKIVASASFEEDAKQIYSSRVADELKKALGILEVLPGIGSKIIRDSLKLKYGDNVYKYLVGPFDLIYEYFEEDKVVYLHALVHQRSVI